MARSTPRKGKGPKKDDNVLGRAVKALGRAAAQNPVVAQNLKYAQAVQAGPTAVAKTVAVDLAAGAIGAGVGKVFLKAAPIIKSKYGREIGVHFSDAPNLKRITYSAERAGSGYGKTIEPFKTYKFSPTVSKGTEPPLTSRELAKYVANQHAHMAKVANQNPKSFGYVTRSRRGQVDPGFGAWETARTVGSQKVVGKVSLPTNTDAQDVVARRMYQALLRAERSSATRTQTQARITGGSVGIGIQQTGSRKSRGGGKNKR